MSSNGWRSNRPTLPKKILLVNYSPAMDSAHLGDISGIVLNNDEDKDCKNAKPLFYDRGVEMSDLGEKKIYIQPVMGGRLDTPTQNIDGSVNLMGRTRDGTPFTVLRVNGSRAIVFYDRNERATRAIERSNRTYSCF